MDIPEKKGLQDHVIAPVAGIYLRHVGAAFRQLLGGEVFLQGGTGEELDADLAQFREGDGPFRAEGAVGEAVHGAQLGHAADGVIVPVLRLYVGEGGGGGGKEGQSGHQGGGAEQGEGAAERGERPF